MADRYKRLGIDPPALPEMGELVRWEPTPGRVLFGRIAAYQTNMRQQVIGLMVIPMTGAWNRTFGDPETWPLSETTVVDLSDPKQMMEWMHSE